MKKIISTATVFLPAISFAHPGHGTTDGYTITHYFTEPQHIAATIITMAAVVGLIVILRSRKKQQA